MAFRFQGVHTGILKQIFILHFVRKNFSTFFANYDSQANIHTTKLTRRSRLFGVCCVFSFLQNSKTRRYLISTTAFACSRRLIGDFIFAFSSDELFRSLQNLRKFLKKVFIMEFLTANSRWAHYQLRITNSSALSRIIALYRCTASSVM